MCAAIANGTSAPEPLRLERSRRLTRPAQFVAVLKVKPIARSRLFALHILPNEAGMGWRFGLVVPKRFEVRAVGRNAIKRNWRESLRMLARRLDKGFEGHDLVVRLVAKPEHRQLARLKQECRLDAARLIGELQRKLARNRLESPCATSSSP